MSANHLTHIRGRFWQMLFTEWAAALLAPARSPEGRFHYNGQAALYLSETPKGCFIASKRYMTERDPDRAIYPLFVTSNKIIDLRDPAACAYYKIDTTHRAAQWQDIRATSARSPTWDLSDKVRKSGIDGILYASRTQPKLTHLTLFSWNSSDGTTVKPDGEPQTLQNGTK